MNDVEEDPELRQHVNLYKRNDFELERLNDADDPTFQGPGISELLDNLELDD